MSRAAGSHNFESRPSYNATGAASSAAKQAKRFGVRAIVTRVFIRGEGWVPWTEIERQVDRAFAIWRQRKALAGVFLYDGRDDVRAHISEAKNRKAHA